MIIAISLFLFGACASVDKKETTDVTKTEEVTKSETTQKEEAKVDSTKGFFNIVNCWIRQPLDHAVTAAGTYNDVIGKNGDFS